MFPVSQQAFWAIDLHGFHIGDYEVDLSAAARFRGEKAPNVHKLIVDSGTIFLLKIELFNLPRKTFREPSAEPSAKTFRGTFRKNLPRNLPQKPSARTFRKIRVPFAKTFRGNLPQKPSAKPSARDNCTFGLILSKQIVLYPLDIRRTSN